jgi:predicted DNA repair protein MutK
MRAHSGIGRECKPRSGLGSAEPGGQGGIASATKEYCVPGGLVALLDDVSIIARAAAASVDDIGVAASRAGTKTAGVVIDDAAVTPSYVTGLSPARELPIIWNITKGSLKNKLIILLPGALLLSWLLPSAIIFILMLGGGYLSYEGAEKVMEKLGSEKHGLTVDDEIADPVAFEKQRVAGAIRTDLILSAEIMAITLNEVASEDIGLHLREKSSELAQTFGQFLVTSVPYLLTTLSFVGTIAMLWVGGGIILHSLHELGLHGPSDWAHGVQHMVEGVTGGLSGILGWTTYAGLSALAGLGLGFVLAIVIHNVFKIGKTHGHG